MSSTIPKLTLFPLYPGGPQVQSKGNLNANSSFTLPANQFSPAIGVNTPPRINPANIDSYFTIGRDQTLSSRPVGSLANAFETPLGLNGLGSVKQARVPAVAPTIPNLYRAAAELLSISDLKMADLMAQPSFRMPNIGMGILVETDGMGGVDTIAINPSSRAANPDMATIGKDFGRPNRAEITTGATFKADVPAGLGGNLSNSVQPGNKKLGDNGLLGLQNPAEPLNLNSLSRNAGIFSLNRLDALQGAEVDFDLDNDILARLAQLQPPENGLPVVGFDATVTAQQAKLIAVNQAGLGVEPGERFRDNAANLASGARQADSYSAAFKPQALDGRIPLAPSLPNTTTQAGNAFGEAAGFKMDGSMPDAMSRKSSGGYLPFQMQSNAGGGQGQPSPFSMAGGFSGGQARQQQQRRPMAFMA